MNLKSLAVVVSCMCCLSVPVQANAAEKETVAVNAVSTGEVEPLAAGLISTFLLSCTSGTKTVYITAATYANERMSEIGFTDIKIQRSSDRTNWTTEKTVSDKIKEDSMSYALNDYAVTVQGGYYYRVQLTHYAKEDTWWFPDEQTVTNTSSYVWVA
ncbi:MAG: hypothetical protein IJN43_06685 [Ruminococcus sp.]|nr:hypothetical protein [Ruminococcus sp.]